MKIVKQILALLFIFLGVNSFAYNVTNTPTIDFGSVSYLYGNTSGFNGIVVTDGSGVSTTGSGALYNHSGGAVGSIVLGNFSTLQGLQPYVEMYSGPFEVTTSTCGKITITNITTEGGETTANKWRNFASTVTFALGGTLTFNYITATAPCYIQGTISNAFQHRPSQIGSWTKSSIQVKVYVIPHMALAHETSAALDFGTICSAEHQQTLTVSPNGNTSSSNLICPIENTRPDSFIVTGNIGQSFSVGLPNSITITSGSNSLNVSNIASSCTNNCVLTGNTYNFHIGGTLTIPAYAALGDYTGTYQVRITY